MVAWSYTYSGVPNCSARADRLKPLIVSVLCSMRVVSGKSWRRFSMAAWVLSACELLRERPVGLFAKEKVPPDLPVCHRCWHWCGGGLLDWCRAGLCQGDDGLVLWLYHVSFGARPILHSLVGGGVGNLGLQGRLCLHGLRSLGSEGLGVLPKQVELLEP